MSARIIRLDDFRGRSAGTCDGDGAAALAREALAPASPVCTPAANSRFQFWSGASGVRYVHTIYPLLECPELAAANYVLVRRDSMGNRRAVSVGRIDHASPSLNLAQLRQRGAELGANEVHVHLLADSERQMKLVEHDLRGGQVAPEAVSTTRH